MSYERTIGRITLRVDDQAGTFPNNQHGAIITIDRGSDLESSRDLSLDELSDLRYLLGRGIERAETDEKKRRRMLERGR